MIHDEIPVTPDRLLAGISRLIVVMIRPLKLIMRFGQNVTIMPVMRIVMPVREFPRYAVFQCLVTRGGLPGTDPLHAPSNRAVIELTVAVVNPAGLPEFPGEALLSDRPRILGLYI